MGTTADKLNKLLNTKQAIKQAIVDKGVKVGDNTKFADYPAKINAIQTGDADSVWEIVTNNYTRMNYLFHSCNDITTLDLSNFDTSNATRMENMFGACSSLTTLDLSNFDTSNVTNMSNMFFYCNKLTSLDVSNFDTSNVTDMSEMFYQCKSLTTLDLSNFNTSKVTDMAHMFYYCINLTTLDVSNFNTSKVTDMSGLFQYCQSLTSLDLSNWDVGHITAYYYFYNMIDSCPALVDFKAPKNISTRMDVNNSNALSHDSLMSIINNLITRTSTETLIFGATNLAKLSSDEIAIATNKGWTIK